MPLVRWNGNHVAGLVRQPDSGAVNRADKTSWTELWRGPYDLCVAGAPAKGVVGGGEYAGWVVASSSVTKSRGQVGLLTIVWESSGGATGQAPLPLDTYRVTPMTIKADIRNHPRYAALRDDPLFPLFASYTRALSATQRQQMARTLNTLGALAIELLDKLDFGVHEYDACGCRYEWVSYSWTLPWMTLGGYLEYSVGGLMYGRTPPGFTFRRLGDSLDFNGTYYTLTRTWEGAPTGVFPAELYTS